jgi:hypothetical protein
MAVAGLAVGAAPAYAQGTEPAGGAAIGEIVIASTAAAVLTTALLVFGIGHRRGRVQALGRLSALFERRSGLPGWVALPSALAAISLITAVIGMYWDISLHIDVGRDEGPLANPAHYFILAGLFGIFTAGFLAMVLPFGRPSASAVRLGPDWHAPLGGVLICACGAFALTGFPLDDVWHRLFGQDVTLWGPTHLMLIGGASMTLVGIAVLTVEGMRAAGRSTATEQGEARWVHALRAVALTGGLLIGLSTFQAEFDFGVPQFQAVFQPMLIMLAAGVGLVAVRAWAGRGAALGAVAFFLLIRGGLALLIGPILGETTPHLPLYVVEALVVEAVALVVSTRRPLAFPLAAGVGVGSIGLAAEWAWSHIWMPLPWQGSLLPEGALLGLGMAIAGALLGGWIGTRLSVEAEPRPARLRAAVVAGAVAIAAMVGFALYKPADESISASVELADVGGSGGDREVMATVDLEPSSAAGDPKWLTATAWQGGGLVVDELEPVGDGAYRTTEPIPVHGEWKALIRLHSGNSLYGLPVYLPEDEAIPAEEVPARPSFERHFVADHTILQREQKDAAPGLTAIAYGTVLAIALGLLGLLAWGLHRLTTAVARGEPGPSLRDRLRDAAGALIPRPARRPGALAGRRSGVS